MAKTISHYLSGIVLVYICALVIIDMLAGGEYSASQLYYVCATEVIAAYVFLVTYDGYKFGFHFVIMTYMFLCQFGYVFASTWNLSAAIIRSTYSMRFADMPEYITAIEISVLFMDAFILSAVLPFQFSFGKKYFLSSSNDEIQDTIEIEPIKYQSAVFYVGMVVLIAGLLMLAVAYYSTRGVAYSERVSTLNATSWYGHIIILLSYGFTMILACCDKSYWVKALIPYAGVVVLHLLMGNRGEILYCIATCVGIYLLKYKRIKLRWIAIGALALIMLVPAVRVFRESLSFSDYSANILNNIVEMFSELGFQIAPFTYTVELIESGIGFRLGGTYLYGIFDFIGRRIPFIGGMPTESINNIKYMMPQKGLGYSQIAEAYFNFGIIGGFLFIILLGHLVIYFENVFSDGSSSIYKKLFASLFIVELVNLTRNSSGTLMVYTTYIILLMLAVYFVSRLRKD